MEYTTLRIKQNIKDKLQTIKQSKDISYSELLEGLIEGEAVVSDIETIQREKIAFSLIHFSYDREELETYDVSYVELKNMEIGDKIHVPHKYNDDLYYNETAEVVFIDDISVVVRIVAVDINGKSKIQSARLLQVVF